MKITTATAVGGAIQSHIVDTEVMRQAGDARRADLLEQFARDVVAMRVPPADEPTPLQHVTNRLQVSIEDHDRLIFNQIYYRPVPLAAARLAVAMSIVRELAERRGDVNSLGA